MSRTVRKGVTALTKKMRDGFQTMHGLDLCPPQEFRRDTTTKRVRSISALTCRAAKLDADPPRTQTVHMPYFT
jgi:hypothetical protein